MRMDIRVWPTFSVTFSHLCTAALAHPSQCESKCNCILLCVNNQADSFRLMFRSLKMRGLSCCLLVSVASLVAESHPPTRSGLPQQGVPWT